jgi:K+-transporting ATPase A subunit
MKVENAPAVTEQNIVQGPMASQVAIKMLGTNGGGYVNANARIHSKTQRRFQTLFRCYRSSRSAAG